MTNEVIQNILTRCSVRAYDDRPVEREKIDTDIVRNMDDGGDGIFLLF